MHGTVKSGAPDRSGSKGSAHTHRSRPPVGPGGGTGTFVLCSGYSIRGKVCEGVAWGTPGSLVVGAKVPPDYGANNEEEPPVLRPARCRDDGAVRRRPR